MTYVGEEVNREVRGKVEAACGGSYQWIGDVGGRKRPRAEQVYVSRQDCPLKPITLLEICCLRQGQLRQLSAPLFQQRHARHANFGPHARRGCDYPVPEAALKTWHLMTVVQANILVADALCEGQSLGGSNVHRMQMFGWSNPAEPD